MPGFTLLATLVLFADATNIGDVYTVSVANGDNTVFNQIDPITYQPISGTDLNYSASSMSGYTGVVTIVGQSVPEPASRLSGMGAVLIGAGIWGNAAGCGVGPDARIGPSTRRSANELGYARRPPFAPRKGVSFAERKTTMGHCALAGRVIPESPSAPSKTTIRSPRMNWIMPELAFRSAKDRQMGHCVAAPGYARVAFAPRKTTIRRPHMNWIMPESPFAPRKDDNGPLACAGLCRYVAFAPRKTTIRPPRMNWVMPKSLLRERRQWPTAVVTQPPRTVNTS